MKQALIPLAETQKFQIGAPLNPCPGFRYDGSDPRVQFPQGWHCQTNDGVTQGASGAYEQDCGTLLANAPRIAVIRDNGRNVIKLTGGLPGQPGGAMLAHPFPAAEWGTRQLSFETTVKFLSRPVADRYFNLELRGFLNFKARKNESVECVSLQVTNATVMASWYRDARDGDGVEMKCQVKEPISLAHDEYHRITMLLTPSPLVADTWQASFKIRSVRKLVWTYATDETNHPNNIKAPDMIVCGDERSRDDWGGATYIARAGVFAEDAA